MHTSLATSILDQIKSRKLDLFFELEEKIMSKQTLDKSLMQVWLIIFVKHKIQRCKLIWRDFFSEEAEMEKTREILLHHLFFFRFLKTQTF